MVSLRAALLATTLAFNSLTTVTGYKLDPHGSCDSVKDRVVKTLDRGTSMTKDAIDVDFDSPIGKEVAKLNEIIFPDTPKDEVKEKLKKIHKTLTRNNNNEGKNDKRAPVLFCNVDRWEKIKSVRGKDLLRDKHSPDIVHPFFDSFAQCYMQRDNPMRSVLGFRYTFMATDDDNSEMEPEKQDYVQICPSFWDIIKSPEYSKLDDFTDKEYAALDFDEFDYLPHISFIMFAERALLHEYSHSADGAWTVDSTRTGWDSIAEPPSAEDQRNNADSYALYIIGVNLITKKGQFPEQDGTFTQISKQGKD